MNKNHQIHLNKQFLDLNPTLAGEAVLPAGRQTCCKQRGQLFTVLHYLVSGSGILYLQEGQYPIRAGQIFIAFPTEHAYFIPDEADICKYRWVGFTGHLSPTFASMPRVADAPREMFSYLEDKWDADHNLEYRLASDLFFLYAELIQTKKEHPDYIQTTLDYINNNYMYSITLQSIADHVGLNAHYLSRLFKKRTGKSLQSHTLSVRLHEAKRYLQLGYSTKETANLCGFNDTSNFSKLFKKNNHGLSPAAWKKAKDELNAPMIRSAKDTDI